MALCQKMLAVLISVAAVMVLCGAPDTLTRSLGEETVIAISVFGFFVILLSTSTLLLVFSVSQMIAIGFKCGRTQIKSKPGKQNSDG